MSDRCHNLLNETILIRSGQSRPTWMVQSHSPGGVSVNPRPIHACLGPPESTIQSASQSVQSLFAQLTADFLYSTVAATFAHQNCGLVDLDRIYTLFLGPIRVHSPNAISMVSAVFAHAAHDRESLNFTVGRPFLLKVGLSPGGSGLRLRQTWIRDPPEYTTQTASGSVQLFLQG